jgi:methyl-accepting chemotaxis protein
MPHRLGVVRNTWERGTDDGSESTAYKRALPFEGGVRLVKASRKELEEMLRPLHSLAVQVASILPHQEEDFLALGMKVQKLNMSIRDIASQASELNGKVSGPEVQTIKEVLSSELGSFSSFWGRAEGDLTDRELKGIGDSLKTLQMYGPDFRRIVRHLKALRVNTLIESARLEQAGEAFCTLAQDVEGLAGKIVQNTARIDKRTMELEQFLKKVRRSLREVTMLDAECTRVVTGHLHDNVQLLQQLIHSSRSSMEDVATRMEEISARTGEIVASLQFHDITRQQVEHVSQALTDVIAVLKDDTESEDIDELGGWIAQVCTLQTGQIEHGRASLVEAVESILTNLRLVAESVERLCWELSRSMGTDTPSGGSALSNVEGAMKKAGDYLARFARHGESIGATMREFAGMVDEMSVFVSEIEEFGAEIALIALNASIKSAHAGTGGAGLSVLAGEIQRLSAGAGTQTVNVLAVLGSLRNGSVSLQEVAGKDMDISHVQAVIERLQASMSALRLLNQEVSDGLRSMAVRGHELVREIRKTADNVNFHHSAGTRLAQAGDQLGRLAGTLRSVFPETQRPIRSKTLQAITDRYTMESERLIHRSTGGAGVFPDAEIESGSTGDSEFGDNVELF